MAFSTDYEPIKKDDHPVRSEVRDRMRIDWDVPVEMSDGVVLRADVFRPNDNGTYPAILGVTPYGKLLQFQQPIWARQWKMLTTHAPDIVNKSSNRYQNYEMVDPERFVPDGYVCVRVDVRGTGRSPGYMDLLSTRETQDFYECVEWIAKQPWCMGKVGLCGISYLGMNQWQVAALRPPHLTAMCVWEGCSDFYREFTYHGGILSLFGDLWWENYILPVQYGLGKRGFKSEMNGEWVSGPRTLEPDHVTASRQDWPSDVRRYKLANAKFWRSRLPYFSKVNVPLLSAANWGGQGLHLRGNVDGFVAASSKQKWLEFHLLEHWTEFYTDYGVNLQKRFFGHFLKGEDNGFDREPKVMLHVRHPYKPAVIEGGADWPLPNTKYRKFYLDLSSAELRSKQKLAARSIMIDSTADGVTFLTPPLTKTVRIIGHSAAKLFVSSTTEDADLFLILRLFTPDMKEVTFVGANEPHTPLAHGWLRASHRKLDPKRSKPYRPYHPHDAVEKLTPGKIYPVDIELWPTCIEAPPGCRIGLTIRGKDYEYPGDLSGIPGKIGQPALGVGPFRHVDTDDRPPKIFDNQVTLYAGGARQPYILLPIIETEPLPRRKKARREAKFSLKRRE
jgi:predicted acyl esterase